MGIANTIILDMFLNIQKHINPDISIEVGAFNAEFSKEMKYFDIDIFAFEASPYVYETFKNEMEKIKYLNNAVSNKNGKIKFEIQAHFNPHTTGNNSIKNRNEDKAYTYIDVDSVSINEYFNNYTFSKGALWIDAEGASEEVLTGASNKLKDFGSIYIELEHKEFWNGCWKRENVIEYLKQYGFHLFYELPCYVDQSDAIFISDKYIKEINEIIPKPDLAIS